MFDSSKHLDSNLSRSDHAGERTAQPGDETTLRKAAEEKIRRMEIQVALETDRSRIAREIHDELGQSLTVMKMDLFELKSELSSILPAINKRFKDLSDSIDQLAKKSHKIAHELRPQVLEELGLEAGIEWLVNDLKARTSRKINLDLSLAGVTPNKDVALALYRILQEALTNSLRHSLSETIDIHLRKTNTGFALKVRDYDNSKPITYQSIDSLGVIGMKERATSLGGSFLIENNGGTVLSVDIPHVNFQDL